MNRSIWTLLLLLSVAGAFSSVSVRASQRPHGATPTQTPVPTVITFSVIRADEGARFIERFFPRSHIIVDRNANALIVSGTPDEIGAIRQIASGIDTKSPLAPVTQSITLHRTSPSDAVSRLRALYPNARLSTMGKHTILVSASSADLQQIQTLLGAIDAPPNTPTPDPIVTTPPPTEAVQVLQARPKDVARQVAGAIRGLRVNVAGQSILLAGAPDAIQHAKGIIAVLDVPPPETAYTTVYRIRTLDAKSVADLLQRSFPDAKITVDDDINSLSVFATAAEQHRIADGIAQLDAQPSTGGGAAAPGNAGAGAVGSVQVYNLKYALPAAGGATSTSATDLAAMVTQTLSSQAPDLHVNAAPNATQLILTGSPYSLKLAKDLLAQLDVAQRLVVLDTEILEVDENTAKNLGLQLSSITGGAFGFGTVFSEIQPTPDPSTGVTPPLKRFQTLTRTAVGFVAQLNLAIEHGSARVLADPRITTLSGHTATIRAGDNISIQLQAGGGAGTIATTQIQTFQTGVGLDITPIVNDDGLITVALHPVVNSLTGILNGIPQISTRDTQTTVALRENETLVIGGLIQDNTQRTESRIPILGDLPLLGRAFRNETLNGNRNELIISVTPHIIVPGQSNVYPGPPLPAIPTPQALPTLLPGTIFPPSAASPAPVVISTPSAISSIPTPPPITARSEVPLGKPTPLPAIKAPSQTPSPTPQGSAASNTFVYGSQPTSNVASAADPVQIFYVNFSPTLLSYGQPFSLAAITSTNATQLSLSYNGVSVSLPQVGPGQWGTTLPFTLIGNPAPPGRISLSLIASKADGTQTSIPIPVTIASP